MRNHTQLKIFFAAVLIALATLTIVTAPAQVMGATHPNGSAVVGVPGNLREPAQVPYPALQATENVARVAVSHLQRNRNVAFVTPPRAVSFLPAVTYLSGGLAPVSVAVADVNGDGRLDVVVANENSNTVGVLLGKGDGTFQPAVTYGSGGRSPVSIVVADVNGDAMLDLVVANGCGTTCASGTVGVQLGNGDGTFQPAVAYGSVIPTGPVTFVAGTTVLGTAQLNGGKAKLVLSSLPVGSTKVTVKYNGDSNIAKSSASVIQTVQ